MRNNRILAALLAAVLAMMLVLPASAQSSFSDVADPTTGVNADILRLMGVVDGVGGDRFNPNSNLTRAEFCTMVVKFVQKGDQVPLYSTRTIFSDVTAKHWALGYVNLAASLRVKDGDKDVALISGVGDGSFAPNEKVTLAQAATILIRVLGYSSKEAGAVWPQSYMNLAKSIGLTDGISAGTNDAITRAQAAQLFVNALNCKTGAGTDYYKSLGSIEEGAIILAVNVTTDDGSTDGAIRTSANKDAESYLAAAGNVKPTALLGKRGALVLNDKNEIVTFVPDNSRAINITLAGEAKPSYVKGTDGKQYTMSKDTILYTGASGGTAWLEGYMSLLSGSQITMYSESGKIVAVYAGGSAVGSSDSAVVVRGTPSVAMFHDLTGGVSDFAIQKNRQPISLSDIKAYDVVTYDSLTNTLIVSDLRLTCVYEDAAPNAQAPTTVTVLGHEFPVMSSAWETTDGIRVGDLVTLMLTADGQVAGIEKPSANTRSTAVGMITSGGVELFLPNGGAIKLNGDMGDTGKLNDQLVTIASSSAGKINVSKLTSPTGAGTLNVANKMLGNYKIAAGVRVYEQVDGSAVVNTDLTSLGVETVPGSKVAVYHLNSSNMVDYLVLNGITGNAYTYGQMLTRTEADQTEAWTLHYGGGTIPFAPQSGYSGKNGSFVGVVTGENSLGETTIRAHVELKKFKDVSAKDFFVSQGVPHVTVGGYTYRVADEVQCGRAIAGNRFGQVSWFAGSTGEERLAACKAFSNDLTVYVDPISSQVRVVVAN